MCNASDVIEYLDSMIISDRTTGRQCDTLKRAKRIIQGYDSNSSNKGTEVSSDIPKRKYELNNPYKRKSTGKMGKRCMYCEHFKKYDNKIVDSKKRIGMCKFFDIEVTDYFNGCSRDEERIYLHNFDPEEVTKLVVRMEEKCQ